MRTRDGTFSAAEWAVLCVVRDADDLGAMLAKRTDPDRHQVSGVIAKRLARDGVLRIDVSASAHLTEIAKRAMGLA